MSIAKNQLQEIQDELINRFGRSSVIQVKPLEGEPPEKYEITYNLKGMKKDESGKVQTADSHQISIGIPFGFPHFQPNCKPISPTFHPDFDPDAICIGEFWNQDKTLPELIIFIGQMISGEIFSRENAFNEEAAAWYAAHDGQLPFDRLDPDSLEGDLAAEEPIGNPIDELGMDEDDFELDIISDEAELDVMGGDDFELDIIGDIDDGPDSSDSRESEPNSADDEQCTPDKLEIDRDYAKKVEKELPRDEPLSEQEDDYEVDLDLIMLLRKKKRFFALEKQLTKMPASAKFEQRDQLEELVGKIVAETKENHKKAGKLEHQGELDKALVHYKEIKALAADFPNIDKDMERVNNALDLLNISSTQGKADGSRKDNRSTVFEDEENTREASGVVPVVIGIAAALFAGVVIFVYFSASSQYKEAVAHYQKCQQNLEANEFFDASKSCTEALTSADQIKILKSGAKNKLISEINSILESRKMKEGLAGNIEYKGKYLPASTVKDINRFEEIIQSGSKAFDAGDWQAAAEQLSRAATAARNNPEIDRKLLAEIEQKLNTASFHNSYNLGMQLAGQKNWAEASRQLEAAHNLLPVIDEQTRKKYSREIARLLEEAAFISLTNQGDSLFHSKKWQQALIIYQDAAAKAPNYLVIHPEKQQLINEKTAKANLYLTIQSGKEAFANSDWDEAIKKYDAAIEALNKNSAVLKHGNSAESRKKLARIKLQASIIRDQQKAAVLLKDGKYSQAVKKLGAISSLISKSPFSKEQEFAAILAETQKSIRQANDKQFIIGKTSYLKKHYKEIFIKSNPLLTAGNLVEPKIEFVKRVNGRMMFKIQCLERGRGRPVRLMLDYFYNPATNSWSF
ncbi:MAG: hypothetical protein CSB24_05910 [Deltaproteobacteria bacterium]|nr:MAG: hypothetical protein CSB24_05910 [Deltaproteobacteria bacterium]